MCHVMCCHRIRVASGGRGIVPWTRQVAEAPLTRSVAAIGALWIGAYKKSPPGDQKPMVRGSHITMMGQ